MARTKTVAPRRPTSKPALNWLSRGRPPNAPTARLSMSSKATRHLINETHQVQKDLAKAQANGDDAAVDELKKRIANLGGLKKYQLASIQGQANDRGGDSSSVLLQFLADVSPTLATATPKPRLLEIGALSTANACARASLFDITRIDLYSQTDGIIEQDFMERPLPQSSAECFDIISLSLVLNFVPDAVGRGAMLARTAKFLDRNAMVARDALPALFIVLPAPCITNSRYMNTERLTLMMDSLGFVLLHVKQSSKLLYMLWQLRDSPTPEEQHFPKIQVNPGSGRNNFSIVLQSE